MISIHKALAGLDTTVSVARTKANIISIHKALAGLDMSKVKFTTTIDISIHKALAGLDALLPTH